MREKYKIVLHAVTLTIQLVALIMALFFGWLGTKVQLPDGIITFWTCTNLFGLVSLFVGDVIIKRIVSDAVG